MATPSQPQKHGYFATRARLLTRDRRIEGQPRGVDRLPEEDSLEAPRAIRAMRQD